MEARRPATTTPPPAFARPDVLRYVVGCVVEQIHAEPVHGECVYTRNRHVAVCALFGVDLQTPRLVQDMKQAIEKLGHLVGGPVTCAITETNAIDLLHISWALTGVLRPRQTISGISSGGNVKITQSSLDPNDFMRVKQ